MVARRMGEIMGMVGVGAVCSGVVVVFVGAGCVSKSKAEAQARAAYTAGQQEATARMQQAQAQAQGPSVTIHGEVRNRVVPWTEGLTLRQALVVADYCGASDPEQIIVVHNGIGRQYDPRQLFNEPDIPMFPGDIVQLLTRPTTPGR